MSENKNTVKQNLHPRNKNRDRYDLEALTKAVPELLTHVIKNKSGQHSVNFSNPQAVKLLNQAILHHYYGITFWEFPNDNLVPPIPGRAEYIHLVADLLAEYNDSTIPKGDRINCLDIGTGASCIYPIIGVTEYNWNFIGTDIDANSIKAARNIVGANKGLKGKITFRLQKNPRNILANILSAKDKIDITICNPPFHATVTELLNGNKRKVKNLTGKPTKSAKFNFSGRVNELVYDGGEFRFIQNMISESKMFASNCFWFSSLVSKESNLKKIQPLLQKNNATKTKILNIKTGNKMSRIIAWTYLTASERERWIETRWNR